MLLSAAGLDADPRRVHSLSKQIQQWENDDHVPGPTYRPLYARVTGLPEEEIFGPADDADKADDPASDVVDLASWLEQSNVGDGEVAYLETATRRLAMDYSRQPPLRVLQDARQLQARVTRILRGGRQRLSQTQSLMTTSAELFALITLLAGDVGRYSIADAYGYAAWTCADEAGSDPARALVLCAQSKTARWEGRFRASADLARRGFELAPTGTRGQVLLAAQEATALQLNGDGEGALGALSRAHRAQEEAHAVDGPADAWGCPRPREYNYALQVGLGARDPARVLEAAQAADDAWADGDPWVYGTWSQVRIGAALAYVMTGEVEAAAAELEEVFDLGAEFRVVTIIGRLAEIRRRLGHSRYRGDQHAADLRERIRAFAAGSLEHKPLALEVS